MKDEIKKQIKAHALEDPSVECCGMLYINKETKRLELLKSPNLSRNKKTMFELSASHYLKAATLGSLVAVYHSHPEGEVFSEFDILNSETNKIKYILYCVKSGLFKEYVPNGYANPYYGRDFSLGENDCFTLLREFYKKELNIEVKNYYRDANWFIDNPDTYQKYYANEGFVMVSDTPASLELSVLRKFDIILMKVLGKIYPTHAAMYYEDGLVLHHQRDCYSRIEEYNETFRNRATHIIRHKNLL